eukprot:3228099-Rhodomonas_salina.2
MDSTVARGGAVVETSCTNAPTETDSKPLRLSLHNVCLFASPSLPPSLPQSLPLSPFPSVPSKLTAGGVKENPRSGSENPAAAGAAGGAAASAALAFYHSTHFLVRTKEAGSIRQRKRTDLRGRGEGSSGSSKDGKGAAPGDRSLLLGHHPQSRHGGCLRVGPQTRVREPCKLRHEGMRDTNAKEQERAGEGFHCSEYGTAGRADRRC